MSSPDFESVPKTYKQDKERRGSCSTISSPISDKAHLELGPQCLKLKRKKIKKAKSAKKAQATAQRLVTSNRIIIFQMVHHLSSKLEFHQDSYLICLRIIGLMKFNGEPQLCIHVAASIIYLVSKIYECNKVEFWQLRSWSDFSLQAQILVEVESSILIGLNFELPQINAEWTVKEIELEIQNLESLYGI